MHKQDTAALDTNALVELVRGRELKQWWIARQLNVDTKTVNRWLTGKVKRISRDNLARLCSLLACEEAAISLADEADLRATRSEQNIASTALLSTDGRRLFLSQEEFTLFETLLKATMHPDMTVSQLSSVYKELMVLAARQNKLDEARRYSELTIEYASRSGDIANEMAARNNLIVLAAQGGRLADAGRQLEQHIALSESVGDMRAVGVTLINLVHVRRLLADYPEAIRTANRGLSHFPELREEEAAAALRLNSAHVAWDLGWIKQARAFMDLCMNTPGIFVNERARMAMRITVIGLDSVEDPALVDPAEVLELSQSLERFTNFGQSYYLFCTEILRRCGRLAEAWQQSEAGLASAITRNYEHPLFLHEQARILQARGLGNDAREMLRRANAGYHEFDMDLRVTDDPALEVQQQFRPPARLRLKDPALG